MADSNWKMTEDSGLVPRTPEHSLVWHIYESVFVYALVIGVGLWAWIQLPNQTLGVLCSALCILGICIWSDLKKRKQLRHSIEARLGRSLVLGRTAPLLCSEALRVLGYEEYVPKREGRSDSGDRSQV